MTNYISNPVPSQTQFLDLEAAILTYIYGLNIYRTEEIVMSDFKGKMPYAYKVPKEDNWKVVYPHGSINVMPMRSLDGAYWTAAQTLKWLNETRAGAYYTITCKPSFEEKKLTMSFTVTFECWGHVFASYTNEYLEVAMGMACLAACGKEVNDKTWSVL